MKLMKTAAVLAAAILAFQYLPEMLNNRQVNAETENDSEIVDALVTGYEGDADDPETFKVITSSQPTSQAVSSAANLVHNSKFDNCMKLDCIDISVYQGNIDWNAVAASGVHYAILRVGYRGYDAGRISGDRNFLKNIQGATNAGIKVGAYFFTQAITVQEAIEEAKYCIECVKGYPVSMPIYIDIERTEGSGVNGRLNRANLSIKQRTDIAEAFCKTIQEAGYEGGIYSSKSYFLDYLDPDYLSTKYKIWLAHYTSQTSYKGDYQLWQYSSTGRVSGISGNVDMNILYSQKVNFAQDAVTIEEPDTPVKPEFSGDGTITFESADPSVATVDAEGNISGVSSGTTVITAFSDNGSRDTITVNVDFPPAALLNYSGMVFQQLGASEAVTQANVTLSSSDANVVSIAGDGTATAVGCGTAIITAEDSAGNVETCNVVVSDGELTPGDCNADGIVNAIDAVYILNFSAESAVTPEKRQFADSYISLYDFNADGAVDAVDASDVLTYSAYAGVGYYTN